MRMQLHHAVRSMLLLSLLPFSLRAGSFRADVAQIIATNSQAVILLVIDSPMERKPRIFGISADGSSTAGRTTNKYAAATVTNVLRELHRLGFFELDDKKVRQKTRAVDEGPNQNPRRPRGFRGVPIASDGSQDTLRVCYDGRTNVFTWPHVYPSLDLYPSVKELKTFRDAWVLVYTNFAYR
jgi:hypothetical protein